MKHVMRGPYTYLLALLSVVTFYSCDSKEGEKAGKVFRYNQAEGLTSLDPAFARNQANIWAITQMYNGLFEVDKYLHAVPALVDSWEVSEDGKTWTFKLKSGVFFQDNVCFANGQGREVTAKDFVYSFKRLIDPATSSTGAWIFSDKVLTDAKGAISDTAFKAVDDQTLKIYLRKSFPPFLMILTMPYTCVVPHEAVEKYGKDFGRNPVGTGPFILDKWEEGTGLVMKKNPDYWRKDDNGQKLPYIDRVQISFIPDKNQAFSNFMQGKLDFISGVEESSKDVILNSDGSIKKDFSDKYQVFKSQYLNTEYIGFQLDSSKYPDGKHPFLDKRVRQAMSYAVNRRDLVAFLRNKLGVPGEDGIVPTVMPSFDSTRVVGYTYNLDTAQQLLNESGFPNGTNFPPVTLYTNPNHKELSEFLQKAWKEIGINVQIEINALANHQELIENGKATLFRASWLGDYPDAENYLAMFFSKNFSPAGPNKTHFHNRSFDDLFEKVMMEQDGFKRYQLYNAMDELVMKDAPVIVLYYDEVLRLTQKNVRGLDVNYMNLLQLEKVDVKTEAELAQEKQQQAAQ